jgi:hypothetical protein
VTTRPHTSCDPRPLLPPDAGALAAHHVEQIESAQRALQEAVENLQTATWHHPAVGQALAGRDAQRRLAAVGMATRITTHALQRLEFDAARAHTRIPR